MSDCLSLISTDVDLKDVASWVDVSQMTHILHTEPVIIKSIAGGYLDIEPYCVENMDCRIIGGLVYHCCDRGVIHSWTDERICHVFQNGPDTCVKLDCWEINGKDFAAEPDLCWVADPCQRLEELRCCEWEWLKVGKKTSWSFRDSSGSTTFLTQARLTELINQAEMQCEAKSCQNSRCKSYSWNNGYC